MKNLVLFSFALIIFSSCSHRIVRSGYQVNKSDYQPCEIVIKKNFQVSDSMLKMGEIKLGETGFSTYCSEAHAIEILTNEGCALNADLINITEENRPDLWSSCYRCTAEFYRFSESDILVQSDEEFVPDQVEKRISKDKKRNVWALTGSIIVGTLLGYYIGYNLF